MRGMRAAAAAAFLSICVISAGACQLPGGWGSGPQDRPAAVVAWWSGERSPVPPFAASEVARYLSAMSGEPIATAAASFRGKPPGGVAAALVVMSGQAAAEAAPGSPIRLDPALVAAPAASLGPAAADAFAADVVGGDQAVLAAADERGILDAAYDFLERLGVTFFAPGFSAYRGHAETVPRRSLALPAYQTSQR